MGGVRVRRCPNEVNIETRLNEVSGKLVEMKLGQRKWTKPCD